MGLFHARRLQDPDKATQNPRMKLRTVILAGATGLVGREILQGLLADPGVCTVHTLGRRPPATQHPKLTAHIVDFAALPPLPAADELYLALGTTIKVAGSQAARPPFARWTTTPT